MPAAGSEGVEAPSPPPGEEGWGRGNEAGSVGLFGVLRGAKPPRNVVQSCFSADLLLAMRYCPGIMPIHAG